VRGAELEGESAVRRAQNELGAERDRLKQELDAERARAQSELEAERARIREIEAGHARGLADAQTIEAQLRAELAAAASVAASAASSSSATKVSAAAVTQATDGVRALDGTSSLTAALDALLAHAAPAAGRAALFLIEGDRVKLWKAAGIPDGDARAGESGIGGTGLIARAIQAGRSMQSSAEVAAPPFARLDASASAAALPIMIGGRAVAVLYADGPNDAVSGAFATLEVLARHASAVVALRTAMRTLDVLRGVSPDAPGGSDALGDDQGARRFAKLLISEIKLYNEAAVRAGRQEKDLLRRLRVEIDRAQRLYEERVPAAIGARHAVFQQELVQTLADGDPALLGSA
jgi:hypothetical protein